MQHKARAIIRAYDDGMTLQAISQLFKIEEHCLINIIHAYKIGRKKKWYTQQVPQWII